MKAQISLEFLIAIAVYLALISVLLHVQNNILLDLKENTGMFKSSLNEDISNLILSMGRIYTSEPLGPINYKIISQCRAIGDHIYCGIENVSKCKIYAEDTYESTLR
jgi:hypothetical protein